MSHIIERFKKIENLDPIKLAEALELNGYSECANAIRVKNINGYAFLKLTEVQISLWRLPIVQSRRLWSFVQQVNQDPTQFVLKPELNIKPPISANKPQMHKVMTSSGAKSESFLHKSKIVQQSLIPNVVKNPSTSVDDARDQVRTFPKPPHLITPGNSKKDLQAADSDEENDGYLSPVSNVSLFNFHAVPQETLPITVNKSSFLNKFRQQHFDNLEHRRQSVENKYEIQKPLSTSLRPPLPAPNSSNRQFDNHEESEDLPEYTDVTEEDEELPEYTDVLEDERENVTKTTPILHRPLPPVPNLSLGQSSKTQLPTPTIPHLSHSNSFSSKPHLPSPNVSHLSHSHSFSSRPRLPSSSDSDISNSSFVAETKSKTNSNPNVALQNSTLRKSPINLPKPPSLLPKPPPDVLIVKPQINYNSGSKVLLRPLPTPPTKPPVFNNEQSEDEFDEDDEELTDYCEVSLENDPYYRDTDRKGAKLLLNGLEDGAFLIRPSRQPNYICSFSIMHHLKMFNLGVEKRDDGSIGFENITSQNNQPLFYGVDDIISYYSIHPLIISGQTLYLKKILPQHLR